MEIRIMPVKGLPEIKPGDDLADMILSAVHDNGLSLADGDVLVLAQKAVSKAEGRLVHPSDVQPSPFAVSVAAQCGKDPREVEVILQESRRMVRMARGSLIMETRHGFVCANAGLDKSNIGDGMLCLLPENPDASASEIRRRIHRLSGLGVAVIIADTFGRPWRIGQTNIAIGLAGMLPFADYRGTTDTFGHELRVTQICLADEIAGAAEMVMRKVDRVPVAIIRGCIYARGEGKATDLVRPAETDMFR
jgi:coenzyme F420-0:L-glutamate ligase / coenzyme F420-1:gamma-L-glutamate ligase